MDKPEPIWPLFGDDSYDGLPPVGFAFPTAAQEKFEFEIHRAIDEFERVATITEELHYRLSHACLYLAILAARKCSVRASCKQRDALIHWIFHARFAAARYSAESASNIIKHGFDGLMVLAVHIGESDVERANRSAEYPDLLRDAFDFVRIMRNWSHNEALIDRIEDRAVARRNRSVQAIITAALEAVA